MNPSLRIERSRIPRYLVGIAAVLAGVTICEGVLRTLGVFVGPSGETLVFEGEFLVGVLTTVPFVAGIGYAGYWLPRSDLESARYPRILRWLLRGAVLSLAFNLLLIAVIGVTSVAMFVAWVRWSVAVGAGLGLAIGVSEGRAVQKSVEAELARDRSARLTRQRDLLNYLNSFLRHEGLNTVQVISGHAKLLMEESDPGSDAHAHSEVIYRRSEDITDVITDVRLLIKVAHEETPLEPVDVGEVLRREIEKLEDRDERIEVTASIPGEAYVRANSLLKHVFGNLLANAVEHNDSDVPRVRVSVTRSEESVVVDVADNGSGIPDDRVPDLFGRPDSFATDHGLGLFLIGELAEQYDGSVELAETGEDGSVFRVELPRIAPDADEITAGAETAPDPSGTGATTE
ncbi:sensor histidine kinase [Halosimplex aquaticum]|uniref:histidine kinase n=1 Tax=Halosimplex aquaticum TaxID=3026162 RepID=A0ABD5Y6N0_9EURY|nr:HAMP domain-containing sensor histidine kinase [Halosimplex aquaticum]